MPTFFADQLQQIASRILQGAGVPSEHAGVVAENLADANLVGHDSHGVIRLAQYIERIQQGFNDPTGSPQVVLRQASLAFIDGHNQLGQVVATQALQLALEQARVHETFTVLCRNCWHVGRLGFYTERAARQGFVAMMAVNSPAIGRTAPWGGLEPRLGTNPISIAVPWRDHPVVLDMASTAAAEGKIRVAYQKGESIPEGWLIDAEGNPVTDPATLYRDEKTLMLPLGGTMGHKGYGLGVVIDLLCGILSGYGFARQDIPRGANGVWLHLIDRKTLMTDDDCDEQIERYVAWIKSSRKAPGFDEIFMPGEIEQRQRALRSRDGVLVPDETWQRLEQLAANLKVSLKGI